MASTLNQLRIFLKNSDGIYLSAICYFTVDSWYGSTVGNLEPSTDSNGYYSLVSGSDYTTWSTGTDRYPKSITIKKATKSGYTITLSEQTANLSYKSMSDKSVRTSGAEFNCVAKTDSSGSIELDSYTGYYYVQDTSGNPVSGATISFKWSGMTKVNTATTDSNGKARIYNRIGSNPTDISISKDGYVTQIKVLAPVNLGTVAITLYSSGLKISGTVYDYGKRTVASGVSVIVHASNSTDLSATTNSSGIYSITVPGFSSGNAEVAIVKSSSYNIVGGQSAYYKYITSQNEIKKDFLIDTTKTLSNGSIDYHWIPFKEFLVVANNQNFENETGDIWKCLPYSITKKHIPLPREYDNTKLLRLNTLLNVDYATVTNGSSSAVLTYSCIDNRTISGELIAKGTVKIPRGFYIDYYFVDSSGEKVTSTKTEQINTNKTFIYKSESYYDKTDKAITIHGISTTYTVTVGVVNGTSTTINSSYDTVTVGYGKELFVRGNKSLSNNFCLSTSSSTSNKLNFKPQPTGGLNIYQITIPYSNLSNGLNLYVLQYDWNTGSPQYNLTVNFSNTASSYSYTCYLIINGIQYDAGNKTFTQNDNTTTYTGNTLYNFVTSKGITNPKITALKFILNSDSDRNSTSTDEDSRQFYVSVNDANGGATTMAVFDENNEYTHTLLSQIDIMEDLKVKNYTIAVDILNG